MFVALSIGMLTGLTATAMSQVEPAFAVTKKCENSGNDNCNDRNKKIEQENNCKIENENDDGSDSNGGNSNTLTCSNFAVNPEDVSGQVGHDQVFGPIPSIP